MKKLAKIIACAALAVACVSAVALSACGGAKTYTYKVEGDGKVDGQTWYSGIIGSGYFMGDIIGDCYMEDTLTLDGGDYTLVKYVTSGLSDGIETLIKTYAGDDADLSDLKPIEFKYTYYGTYTQDGDVVTLSKASSVDWYECYGPMSAYVNMGKDGSGEGVTDETATNDVGDVIIMSTIYGPLLAVNTTMGNCSQKVQLSDDGFTFIAADED